MLAAGTLRVTLQYAKDIKNCDWIGKQDPYVRLRVGSQERRSRVCRSGGRSPVWDETFDFTIINENTLDMTLMDEDLLSRDDLIGSCSVSLARARELGRDVVQAPVSDGKKQHRQCGFLQVTLTFAPNAQFAAGPAYGAYSMPAAPAAAACTCTHPPHPSVVAPYGYSYPPAPAPSNGPSASFYPAPSFQYSSSSGQGQPVPPPPAPGWPVAAPAYGTPAYQQPSYYSPPSAPAAVFGGYYGGASHRGVNVG